MHRKKPRKPVAPNSKPRQLPGIEQQLPKLHLRWFIKLAWEILVGIGVIVGLLTGAFALRSDVHAEPFSQMDPTDPFKTEFFAENDSVLSIHDLKSWCEVEHAESSIMTMDHLGITDSPVIPELKPKERTSLNCNLRFASMQFNKAYIALRFDWRPSYRPFRKNKAVCFYGIKNNEGVMSWAYRPCGTDSKNKK
jgi:hypothetical protein